MFHITVLIQEGKSRENELKLAESKYTVMFTALLRKQFSIWDIVTLFLRLLLYNCSTKVKGNSPACRD